ncbi:MAG: hypothetical protein ABIG10_02445 [bacterium]
MEITQKQRDGLWGGTGPYSEIRLCIETRILDDKVSRIFAIVEASINPFTYRLIKKNRKKFKDDEAIQQLLDRADYRGQKYGYVTYTFSSQLVDGDKNVMKQAQAHVKYTKKTLIKMHKYVIEILDDANFV